MFKYVYYLSLGSNIANRLTRLKEALKLLEQAGFEILAISGVYETEPLYAATSYPFLNCCVRARSSLKPEQSLLLIKRLERIAGRQPELLNKERYSARALDIDIVWVNGIKLSSKDLTIPHPEFQTRSFVLVPLLEIAREPNFKKLVLKALKQLPAERWLGLKRLIQKEYLW
jgi:2-amino-4-hydroxy-6-hydroxymethyldihydropteridine diphosphokinase